MYANDEIYIVPVTAKKKMKLAQEKNQLVYIYGSGGCGKTLFIKKYLGRKKYQYFDGATVFPEELEIEKSPDIKIVVIDNLQFAESEEVREKIQALTRRRDVWLILSGRGEIISWLLVGYLKSQTAVKIHPKDLCFSVEAIQNYFELNGIFIDEKMAGKILQKTEGNALYIKFLKHQIEWMGKIKEGKLYELEDTVWEVTEKGITTYFEQEIFEQWKPDVLDFFMQMSMPQQFDLKMARAISGRNDVEAIIEKGMEIGNFLEQAEGNYYIRYLMRKSLQKRLLSKYENERRNDLYYNIGRYFRQEGKYLEALEMFEKCGDKKQISEILIENARINPGAGYLYELRHYYLALSEEMIEESAELMSGMCMLCSILLNLEESERWYGKLKEKEKQLTGKDKKTVRSWLAYLDISIPHRGEEKLIDLMKSLGILVKSKEVTFPEFCVTSNAPSNMNGGKDFCEWSKRDKEIAAGIGKILPLILGKDSIGLVELALAESFFEKGGDSQEIIRLITKGQMQAESSGKIEQCFVAVGLLINLHIIQGQLQEAYDLLREFKQRVIQKSAVKLLPNIENLFCKLDMYKGEKIRIAEWLEIAPKEQQEFCTFDRYQYLTKIRIYIWQSKYTLAQILIEKMLYYAQVMRRTYVHMECEMLQAVMQYRMKDEGWKETFQKAYSRIEEYQFVRLISREGNAVLSLLKEMDLEIKNEEFYKQVMKETRRVAEYYPSYMKMHISEEGEFSENAIRILRLQAEGLSYEGIAKQLGISAATVNYHCKQTYKKLGVSGKAAAVTEARRRKLI